MSQRARVIAWVLGVGLLGGARPTWAYALEDVRIEWWTGSGAHEVLLVVDFWPYNGQADSFAFGCRFDASEITGAQLLDAVQAAVLSVKLRRLPAWNERRRTLAAAPAAHSRRR